MKLERVELQGFRSFRNITTIDFDDEPGLVRLAGDNGHGKSSLWKGITFCLYGKTDDGLKGPDLATWEAGFGIYSLVLVNGHKVLRTWGKVNQLLLDDEDATQDDIDRVVGLTFEQYLHSRYFTQKSGRTFLDLGPTEKTDLLASVLDLDRWLDYSKAADERRTVSDRAANRITGQVASAEEHLADLRAADLPAQRAKWEADHLAAGVVLGNKLSLLTVDRNDAEKVLERAHTRLEASIASASPSADRLEALEASGGAIRQRLADAKAEHKKAAAEIGEMQSGTCPTCGQALPHLRDTKHLERAMRSIQSEFDAASDRAVSFESSIKKAREDVREHRDLVQGRRDDVHAAARALESLEARIKEQRSALRRHDSEDNPFDDLIRTHGEELVAAHDRVVDFKKALASAEADQVSYAYWVKAFKDVRLFLVAEALTALEVEVNSSLTQLGLPDWEIKFAPDSETKKGEVKRGFSVTIMSPMNPGPVPWTVWSGGETTRLRNATTMGLSNLISAYTGAEAFMEVWDEPTNGMTQEGIDALLDCLRDRAQTQGKQIWVIDHRSLASGVFTKTLTAIKVDGVSTLERTDDGRNQGE